MLIRLVTVAFAFMTAATLVFSQSPDVTETTATYDVTGPVKRLVIHSNGSTTEVEFARDGRVVSRQQSFEMFPGGPQQTVTVQFEHDERGRVVRAVTTQGTAPAQRAEFYYNEEGHLVRQEDFFLDAPYHTRTWSYGADGALTRETSQSDIGDRSVAVTRYEPRAPRRRYAFVDPEWSPTTATNRKEGTVTATFRDASGAVRFTAVEIDGEVVEVRLQGPGGAETKAFWYSEGRECFLGWTNVLDERGLLAHSSVKCHRSYEEFEQGRGTPVGTMRIENEFDEMGNWTVQRQTTEFADGSPPISDIRAEREISYY